MFFKKKIKIIIMIILTIINLIVMKFLKGLKTFLIMIKNILQKYEPLILLNFTEREKL